MIFYKKSKLKNELVARPAGRMRGLKESESGQIGVTRIAGTVGRTKEPPAAMINQACSLSISL